MTSEDFRIRPMQPTEIAIALSWANREGWNPGLDDRTAFSAVDPTGFWIGEINEKPIAVISAVRYGASFGFLGFYIVEPSFRGHGYGIAIWNAAMTHLGTRVIGLDGVVDQQENYRKSGFELAYRNIRQSGVSKRTNFAHPCIRPISTVPKHLIEQFDREHFPADRLEFLRRWTALPHSYGCAYCEGEQVTGYGIIRQCEQGWKIGPLFARNPDVAESILQALLEEIPAGDTFYLDTPEPNPAALQMATNHQMTPVFETARMYRGPAPAVALDGIYGVTSFELG